MSFENIIGNQETVAAMRRMVETGRVPHAMMLYENDGGGAFPLVLAFLEALYDGSPKVAKLIHPDIHFIFPVTTGSKVGEKPTSEAYMRWFRPFALENPLFRERDLYQALGFEGKQGLIAVADAHAILDTLSLTGVEGGYRTVVLYLPEKMNPDAANRLLKIVEEPTEMTLFLMITHAPERVLKTISSRCLSIRVLPPPAVRSLSEDDAAYATLFADLMEAVLAKDLLSALEVGESLAALSSREKQKEFCRYAGEAFRNLFLLQQGVPALVELDPEEQEFYQRLAAGLKKSFPRLATTALDRALRLIERNVNQKIVFADLADRFYALN